MKSFIPDRQPHHKATGHSGGFFPADIELEVYQKSGESGIRIIVKGRHGAKNIILPLSFARDLPNLKHCLIDVEFEWRLDQLRHQLKKEEDNGNTSRG